MNWFEQVPSWTVAAPAIVAPALLIALLWDLLLGEPPAKLHPVVWMGTLAGRAKAWTLRGTSRAQLCKGTAIATLLPLGFAGLAWLSLELVGGWWWLQIALAAFWIKSSFALRGLAQAARTVVVPLRQDDLSSAREGLRNLCSRDPRELKKEQLLAGTLESISENTSDSVVAPVMFLLLFGVPGILFYRAVNTLDAIFGYRGELEYAGKASARLDDVLNWFPARLTAGLLLLAGGVSGASLQRGVAVLWRDRARTESPNAGWPMAAFAGLLGVQLDKPGHYALGDAVHPVTTELVTRGLRIVYLASLLCVIAVGLILLGVGYL